MREVLTNTLLIHKAGMKVSVSFMNTDKLTGLNIQMIRQVLIKLICKHGTHLELDFSGIRFMDGDGFDTLNLIHRLGKKYGSIVTLKGVETEVLEMIDLVKKYHVFHIHQIKPVC